MKLISLFGKFFKCFLSLLHVFAFKLSRVMILLNVSSMMFSVKEVLSKTSGMYSVTKMCALLCRSLVSSS